MSIFSSDSDDPRTWNCGERTRQDVIDDVSQHPGEFSVSGGWLARVRDSDGKVVVYKAVDVVEIENNDEADGDTDE